MILVEKKISKNVCNSFPWISMLQSMLLYDIICSKFNAHITLYHDITLSSPTLNSYEEFSLIYVVIKLWNGDGIFCQFTMVFYAYRKICLQQELWDMTNLGFYRFECGRCCMITQSAALRLKYILAFAYKQFHVLSKWILWCVEPTKT